MQRRSLSIALLLGLLAAATPSLAKFVDRSAPLGLAWNQRTWGAVFSDLDADGDLDIYVGHHTFSPWLYWNDGTGLFNRFTHLQPWTGDTDRHGALFVSFDDDPFPEIFVAHGADGGNGAEKSELYRALGDGTFAPVDAAGGVSDVYGRKRAASAADVDTDGLLDFYVAKAPDPASPNSLYLGSGDCTFTDVAPAWGIAEVVGTVGSLFGDVDDDGDPDLLVGGEEFGRATIFWRNDGNVFADASALFTPSLPVISGADFGDYDNDGDLDLAVCDGDVGVFDTFSEGDTLRFFFNRRFAEDGVDGLTIPSIADTMRAELRVHGLADPNLVFLGPNAIHPVSVTPATLTDDYVGEPSWQPGTDSGIFVWRTAPGGDWEMRCSSSGSNNIDTFHGWFADGTPIQGATPHNLEASGFVPGGPRVWRNDGASFVEATGSLGLPGMLNPRDVSWVDYDNDGDLDLHAVDFGTSASPNAPDMLLRNDGSSFSDVTQAEDVAGRADGMGDGAVWADVDGDEDLDLFLQEGAGPAAFSAFGPSSLLRNEGDRGRALLLDLEATTTSPAAVGARITVWASGVVVHRRVLANSWRGFQDPLRVHVGLGAASVCDSLRVVWPSGVAETWTGLGAGGWRLLEGVIASPVPSLPASRAPFGIVSLFPQPSRAEHTLVLALERAATVEVSLFDVGGRRLATWHRGPLPRGRSTIRWDGRSRGSTVPAGVYFLRIEEGARALTTRIVRVR